MTRHSLAFTILALAGIVLTLPGPAFARASFRPAFTTGPFRIVLPSARPRMMGTPGIHRSATPARAAILPPRQSVTRTGAAGPGSFRMHHRFRGSVYPVTVGADGPYYGTPYDPSDIPLYQPIAAADEALGPVIATPGYPAVTQERGCRVQHMVVPLANGRGESEITIVRC